MKVTVQDVMAETRNYFQWGALDDTWTMKNEKLTGCDLLLPGDWVALCGSRYNSGVWQVSEVTSFPGAQDETWTGRIWLLAPPQSFLEMCEEISDWCEQHPDATLRRESFGSYSMERAVGYNGLPMGWRDVFRADLVPYRRVYPGVKLR